MIKKILFLFVTTFFLLQCGFSPIHSSKSVNEINFAIKEIELKGDRDINNFLKISLNKYKYENNNQNKVFNIQLNNEYKKNIFLKNKSAEVTEYLLSITSLVKVYSNGKFIKNITIKENKNMISMDDKFEEEKYEKTIKRSLANSIGNKIVFELTLINDN